LKNKAYTLEKIAEGFRTAYRGSVGTKEINILFERGIKEVNNGLYEFTRDRRAQNNQLLGCSNVLDTILMPKKLGKYVSLCGSWLDSAIFLENSDPGWFVVLWTPY